MEKLHCFFWAVCASRSEFARFPFFCWDFSSPLLGPKLVLFSPPPTKALLRSLSLGFVFLGARVMASWSTAGVAPSPGVPSPASRSNLVPSRAWIFPFPVPGFAGQIRFSASSPGCAAACSPSSLISLTSWQLTRFCVSFSDPEFSSRFVSRWASRCHPASAFRSDLSPRRRSGQAGDPSFLLLDCFRVAGSECAWGVSSLVSYLVFYRVSRAACFAPGRVACSEFSSPLSRPNRLRLLPRSEISVHRSLIFSSRPQDLKFILFALPSCNLSFPIWGFSLSSAVGSSGFFRCPSWVSSSARSDCRYLFAAHVSVSSVSFRWHRDLLAVCACGSITIRSYSGSGFQICSSIFSWPPSPIGMGGLILCFRIDLVLWPGFQ
jgi:hypothetical protein